MSSKLLALTSGLASLPLYMADLHIPFLNQPISNVDSGTWFLFCAGIVSLIVTRKFVR